jgi:hypothetical protein
MRRDSSIPEPLLLVAPWARIMGLPLLAENAALELISELPGPCESLAADSSHIHCLFKRANVLVWRRIDLDGSGQTVDQSLGQEPFTGPFLIPGGAACCSAHSVAFWAGNKYWLQKFAGQFTAWPGAVSTPPYSCLPGRPPFFAAGTGYVIAAGQAANGAWGFRAVSRAAGQEPPFIPVDSGSISAGRRFPLLVQNHTIFRIDPLRPIPLTDDLDLLGEPAYEFGADDSSILTVAFRGVANDPRERLVRFRMPSQTPVDGFPHHAGDFTPLGFYELGASLTLVCRSGGDFLRLVVWKY